MEERDRQRDREKEIRGWKRERETVREIVKKRLIEKYRQTDTER